MRDHGYKSLVYRWLKDRARVGLYHENSLSSVYRDVFSVEREKNRNRWLSHKKRGAVPLKQESAIVHSSEEFCGTDVHVMLLVGTRNSYRIKNELLEEATEEWISFQFGYTSNAWEMKGVCYSNRSNPPAVESKVLSFYPEEPSSFLQQSGYNREKAVEYAEKYWNTHDPRYAYFGEDDCTNFISQCLHAGGIPMKYGGRHQGWWYRGPGENWSLSWTVAHSLKSFLSQNKNTLGPRAEQRSQAKGLEIGDVICYDWKGNGRWAHNTIVTKLDPNGEPLVNAHSVNSQHRYWEYTDSHAYVKGKTKHAFFHILN